MKILVVEDEPTSLKLAQAVLAADGHQVFDADAVKQALETVLREKPDMILLDLRLPDTDGLTFARQLKGGAETKNIPIIAVTAYPDEFSKQQALEAGCDAYFIKPLNTRTLQREIHNVVSRN
ncbi:MAG: response regulator [candidate division NC10 bacterium]|nr:response regulator [candidate division NC10 bacterium]